jgi:carbonic anhydrase/acetyltransferase-like protein (isoleucine patch superfamily)
VGKNVTIDPSAIIHGPTTIGDNVTHRGRGGHRQLHHRQQRQRLLRDANSCSASLATAVFYLFSAALFMTTLMENTSIAQNTCLQLCVIGRDSFVGAGTTFTDYNVLPGMIRAETRGGLEDTNLEDTWVAVSDTTAASHLG